MQRNQQHIDQRPHTQPSEAKQLPDALLPVPQKESIHSKASQRNAQYEGRRPAISLGPVARYLPHERPVSHAENLSVDGTVRLELGIDRIATALLFTNLFPALGLVAKPANSFTFNFSPRRIDSILGGRGRCSRRRKGFVPAHDRGLRNAGYRYFRTVIALRIVVALEARVGQVRAEGVVRAVACVGGDFVTCVDQHC